MKVGLSSSPNNSAALGNTWKLIVQKELMQSVYNCLATKKWVCSENGDWRIPRRVLGDSETACFMIDHSQSGGDL